jgi:hypothetical protein
MSRSRAISSVQAPTVIQHKHAGFQALWVEQRRLAVSLEGLTLVTIMHPTSTREEVWRAFRHTPAGRRRARDPWVVVVLDGQPCPEGAPWWSRDEETLRRGGHACTTAGRHGLARAPLPGRPA